GFRHQPRVLLQIRRPGEKFEERWESEWPIRRTRWTKLHLHTEGLGLGPEPPVREGKVTYPALGDGVTFLTPPLEAETEITGPAAPHARRGAAARARRGVRARRRDLADLHRGAQRPPHRAHGARPGLRVPRWPGCRAGHARRELQRRRTLPAQRSARPAAGHLRQGRHAALRP